MKKAASTELERLVKKTVAPIKLDVGCGPNPKKDFEGMDQYSFDGKVKHVHDIRKAPWPFKDNSVAEINASHIMEHLTSEERIVFANECYRILVPEGKLTIVCPHWASNRAYGDPTHQWPPVSEMWFYYILKSWRKESAPHTDISVWKKGFDCDFDATWSYNANPDIMGRNEDFQRFAVSWYKEAVHDIVATLKKRKPE